MARKPHRFAANGVELETALSQDDLRAICALAATESTGDLWNGKHKIVETGSGDGWIAYLTKDALIGWSKLMTFTVVMTTSEGRTTLETEIQTYVTTQTTLYYVPVGPKKMVARHSYLQFVHKLANTVREADASARVSITEGVTGSPPTVYLPGMSIPAEPALEEPETSDGAAPMSASPGNDLMPPQDPAPIPAAAAESSDEQTVRVERRPRKVTWRVTPDGMPAQALLAPLLVGRNPAASEGVDYLSVPTFESTVSKTHARFELIDEQVVVTDLDSTNGTFIVDPFDDMVQCEPNVPTAVPNGHSVELGAFSLLVESAPGGRS